MNAIPPTPIVHMELHTGDLAAASAYYEQLCGWKPERIRYGERSYVALDLGADPSGGIVECQTTRTLWLPYVEVREIVAATERARELGASVLLEPREGPAGFRSVVGSREGGEIAFWQPKR